jgi:hypothetical protein
VPASSGRMALCGSVDVVFVDRVVGRWTAAWDLDGQTAEVEVEHDRRPVWGLMGSDDRHQDEVT